MREINLIVIHCAATPPSMDIGVDKIRQWHLDRGWHDVGYHYVIRRNGEIEKGRNEGDIGAHAYGYNNHSVGVCLVGGVNEAGEPDSNFTAEQWESLECIVTDVLFRYDLGPEHVVGHRDLPDVDKACPSFDAPQWASTLKP